MIPVYQNFKFLHGTMVGLESIAAIYCLYKFWFEEWVTNTNIFYHLGLSSSVHGQPVLFENEDMHALFRHLLLAWQVVMTNLHRNIINPYSAEFLKIY